MFQKYCSEYFLREALLKKQDFKPFPKRDDREAWDNIAEEARTYYLEKAEKIASEPVPPLCASEYLEYSENGNRTHFEDKFHARRCNLRDLIIAECCENKGRFYKTILDYTYSICDEFTWVVPAHNNHMYDNVNVNCMPDSVNFDVVDLFAAETASMLSWAYYFFEDSFEGTSKFIVQRIKYEVRRRVLKPFLDGVPMLWMGYEGHIINNWVPWIISNCISSAVVFAEGYEQVVLFQRFMTVLDRFIAEYKPDGGCDEGPGYWNAAGASLFDALELLYDATGGKINLYEDELVKNIGEYILHAHMFDDVFINFADASPIPEVSAGVVYRYGKRVGSEPLMAFGAKLFGIVTQPEKSRFFAYRTIKNAFDFKEIKNCKVEGEAEKQTYLQYLEVCASRDTESGLFWACKGGHNDESHNHNDIGGFMVYKNKKPVIIDPGCETYTAKTFSPERYSIWTMQSQYHNLPVIGGFMEKDGKEYKAENANCTFKPDGAAFSLNVENAYPAEAGIERFERAVSSEYGKDGMVEVHDVIRLKEAKEIKYYLTLADKPEITDSKISVNGAEILFDGGEYSLETEIIALQDKKIISDWRGRTEFYRMILTPKDVRDEYHFDIRIV